MSWLLFDESGRKKIGNTESQRTQSCTPGLVLCALCASVFQTHEQRVTP